MIMPETPKNKPAAEEKPDKERDTSTWEDDQKRREYYYDDAHGYEVFDPENDDEDDSRVDERTTPSAEAAAPLLRKVGSFLSRGRFDIDLDRPPFTL